MTNPHEPALPASPIQHQYAGLTKREIFAMAAMKGWSANPGSMESTAKGIAAYSVEQADALIAALNENRDEESDDD